MKVDLKSQGASPSFSNLMQRCMWQCQSTRAGVNESSLEKEGKALSNRHLEQYQKPKEHDKNTGMNMEERSDAHRACLKETLLQESDMIVRKRISMVRNHKRFK